MNQNNRCAFHADSSSPGSGDIGRKCWAVAAIAAFTACSVVTSCGAEQCPPSTVEENGYCVDDESMSASVQAGEIAGRASGQRVAGTQAACSSDADCQNLPDAMATCDEPDACQGTKPLMRCDVGTCKSVMFIDADEACTEAIERDDCGHYKSVFCSGEPEQDLEACATSCSDDDDCDSEAICADGDCIATESLRDGESCSDDDECKSGHCQNGHCCQDGDCCERASDCPADYSTEAECGNPLACQGTRGMAVCARHSCGTSIKEDDSGCTASVIARACAGGPDITCNGQKQQATVPECADSMMTTANTPSAPAASTPVPPARTPAPIPAPIPAPAPPPAPTPEPVRCTGDDCCTDDSDCGATFDCFSVATCQGRRTERVCSNARCVTNRTVEDDSACNAEIADDCGLYRDRVCTDEQSQSPEECARSCRLDTHCDPANVCVDGFPDNSTSSCFPPCARTNSC
jgi:hypothetical protein